MAHTSKQKSWPQLDEVKVKDDATNTKKMIRLENNVQDGINVRKVYVFVPDLSNIDSNHF